MRNYYTIHEALDFMMKGFTMTSKYGQYDYYDYDSDEGIIVGSFSCDSENYPVEYEELVREIVEAGKLVSDRCFYIISDNRH